ncbi:hypothetical protein Tco_1302632 [Tanacetum coccineum]
MDVDIREDRLGKIFYRGIHQVLVLDFESLPGVMAEGLTSRMLMEHKDAQGQSVFTSHAWRWLFEVRGPLVFELIMELFSTFRFSEAIVDIDAEDIQKRRSECLLEEDFFWGDFLGAPPSYTHTRDPMLRLCHRLIACSIAGRTQAPKKVIIADLFYLRGMDVGSVNIPYLLARYLRMFASGRKRRAMISGGQFVTRLTQHFGLLTEERLQRLTAVPAPLHAPQPPPAARPTRTMAQMIAWLDEDVHGMRGELGEQREAGIRYTSYSDFQIPYVRRTRRRTDDASTTAAKSLISHHYF